MTKNRIEAFSDGVMAIIITIMVLELKVPHGSELHNLKPLVPVFISYVLSFIYIGIYWNNHHHMFHTVNKVNAGIMWWNMALLFFLSLLPFATGWMGENHFAKWTMVVYGVLLLLAALCYYFLSKAIISSHGSDSVLAKAVGNDKKGIMSLLCNIIGIGLCFVHPYIGFGMYTLVAAIWFIPDKRIEKVLE